ncbi:sodium-dependent glucose transporter 1 isoform X1 [Nerophis lumbriciformis]|uniref:sodium-dependent glucose transporter 1 isoform X1 n=1 Tax=Nerophis lumbriciformis TaxID=546530 RepID=UPI002ADFA11C|nr:sodium-dependent glucose transporter 1-like isoform X1 [Nerophis lumbriciformis]
MTSAMSPSATGKKKQVRFASVMEEDEDTLFEQDTHPASERSKAANRSSKAANRSVEPGREERVRGGRRGGHVWMVSMTLCASFLGLGMGISVVGPTFEDLAFNVKKNIANISYIFIGRSAGYIGGSVLGGILFDCMNPNLLLGISMLFTACGMCAIPFCKHALLLTAFMSTIGISMGILDTGGNVLILNTWGEQAGPHLQALHFSFAAGAFVSPIIAKLLFGHHAGSTATNATYSITTAPVVNDDHTIVQLVHSRSLKSMWAYIVIGLFVFLTSFPFFLLSVRSNTSAGKASTPSTKPLVAKHHQALTALLFFFFFAYVGSEVAYGSFIFTYAKDYAHMDQSQAAGLNSVFWAAFAVCRGVSIFFASCMYPGTMILLSLVGTTLSSLFLCLFSQDKVALWVCTALYGASMSSTFPSGIAWFEQYTTVTGRTAATFVVGAALGEMVLPALAGFLSGKVHDHPVLMYLSLITATSTAILFPVMYKLASASPDQIRKGHRREPPDTDDGEFRQALLDSGAMDEEEEEDDADQWNHADFEVIEMDDAASSPSKDASPLDQDEGGASVPASTQPTETASTDRGDSPKLLLVPDRVKRD